MYVVLDVETTGLDPCRDELLSVSGVWEDGEIAIHEFMCPLFHDSWAEAEKVNGISPADVAGLPSPYHFRAAVQRVIDAADYIVGYNFDFDAAFLRSIGVDCSGKVVVDVMKYAAPVYGLWDVEKLRFKYPKLVDLAKMFTHKFDAHDSLSDARATLYCHKQLTAVLYERED